MKAIFRWVMNPDNNPIMFGVAIAIVLAALVASVA
jgi:hypothetical protein